MKHTPGPWKVGAMLIDRAGGADVEINAHQHQCLATVVVRMNGYRDKDEESELSANARLIAAAPDLLGALISLAATARRYLPNYDEHPEIQKADAAIAKATEGEG